MAIYEYILDGGECDLRACIAEWHRRQTTNNDSLGEHWMQYRISPPIYSGQSEQQPQL